MKFSINFAAYGRMLTAAMTILSASAFAQDQANSASARPVEDTKVLPLMSKAFGDIRGKEGVMLTVEYAPGATSARHRHNAHTFVYVLEGSITMQVDGGKEVTLTAGQTFYESPKDIHAVSKNASSTQSAKFLVFFVKNRGAPPVVPVK